MIAAFVGTLAELEPMPDRQRAVAIAASIAIVLLVFELVRRRKLREEYSWVWIATAATVVTLALNEQLLRTLSDWIGAANPASTLFFGAIVFLLGLCVQFSIRLSRLTHRQRTLAQRLALLEEELRHVRQRPKRDGDRTTDSRTAAKRSGDQDEVA